MNEQNVVYMLEYYSAMKKEVLSHAIARGSLSTPGREEQASCRGTNTIQPHPPKELIAAKLTEGGMGTVMGWEEVMGSCYLAGVRCPLYKMKTDMSSLLYLLCLQSALPLTSKYMGVDRGATLWDKRMTEGLPCMAAGSE